MIYKNANMQDEKIFRCFKHIFRLRSSCPADDVALVGRRAQSSSSSKLMENLVLVTKL